MKLEEVENGERVPDETTKEKLQRASDEEVESEDEQVNDTTIDASSSTATNKKKRSKRKKVKAAIGLESKTEEEKKAIEKEKIESAVSSMTREQITQMLAMNPGLAAEIGIIDGQTPSDAMLEKFKRMSLQDIMTGLAAGGRNVKDMASYKFWATQPVPKFGEHKDIIEEKPFKLIDPDKVPKEPAPLPEGYEWVTMDLTQEEEIKEVCDLLYAHYVEDATAMFRLNYSQSFLKWALLSPGWRKDWHVGVRVSSSRKLVAFISGIPAALRVRQNVLSTSEINFLCIHKKLRAKRLAPTLIKEITRRCYIKNIYQAIYTAGTVLPTPISTTRYFHRSLNWQKLYDIGFSPLPFGSTPQFQTRKYALPEQTKTKGLRATEIKDVDAVLDLLKRYLARFEMAPVMTKEEVLHWLVHKPTAGMNQVMWSYVVEDPTTKRITDFVSFYSLESTIIDKDSAHRDVRTAYLYYYATEAAFGPQANNDKLKERLQPLINDALILAKRFKFDVFNALSLMDNALFLEDLKFGKGDGQLHYYLYNYLANPISGGVDKNNELVTGSATRSGVGIMML